jgi:hypothetical protein
VDALSNTSTKDGVYQYGQVFAVVKLPLESKYGCESYLV